MVDSVVDQEYVVVDLETTGLNTKKDEIISFASIPVRGMRLHMDESFFTLIRPEKFKLDSIKYHGITESDLMSAPTFIEVAERIEEIVSNSVIVGYAVHIDVEFLKSAFKKKAKKKLKIDKCLDVAEIESWLLRRRGSAANFKLDFDSLLKIYKINGFCRHSAMGDAFATAYIFLRQLSQLQEHNVTLADLMRIGKKVSFF